MESSCKPKPALESQGGGRSPYRGDAGTHKFTHMGANTLPRGIVRGHRSTWPACCDVTRTHLPPPITMPHAFGCCVSWDSPEWFPPSCLCPLASPTWRVCVTVNYSKKSRPELRSPEPCTAPTAPRVTPPFTPPCL